MRRPWFMVILIMALISFMFASFVFAENPEAETIKKTTEKIDKLFPGEMVKSDDLATTFGQAISIGLGIIGSVALIIFIWSGIIWMTAGGDTKKVTVARDTMVWACLGLFLIFISYILVKFLIGQLDFWKLIE